MKIKNEILIFSDYAVIILTNRKKQKVGEAIIDLEDVKKVMKNKYHLVKRKSNIEYAQTSFDKKTYSLHQIIANHYGKKTEIDHVDRDGLNNRKSNLRIVTHKQNMNNKKYYKTYNISAKNASGITGIFWDKVYDMWQVDYGKGINRIRKRGFKTVLEANIYLEKNRKK